jgi:ABC-2 type transport system ATP-binding protein
VRRVQAEAQELRLEATQDIRPQVAREALEAGAALLSLTLEQPSLDEVYARYFQEVRHAA